MSLELAFRLTEILLALAFLQQSLEHIIWSKTERALLGVRTGLSVVLLTGLFSNWVLLLLSAHSFFVLYRFNGPYNGGSDKMSLLCLYCLSLAQCLPAGLAQDVVFSYLAVQLILSYFISGQVKIVNPAWRNGQALVEVFSYSAYPVSEHLRDLANRAQLLWFASWCVMIFEVLFPFSLLTQTSLFIAIIIALVFHLANAFIFGLNRFVWAWLAAYPSLIWLQSRLF